MRALRIAALAAMSVVLVSTTHAQETVAITGGTIYPVSGAQRLAGATFDLKIELPGALLAGYPKVSIDGEKVLDWKSPARPGVLKAGKRNFARLA